MLVDLKLYKWSVSEPYVSLAHKDVASGNLKVLMLSVTCHKFSKASYYTQQIDHICKLVATEPSKWLCHMLGSFIRNALLFFVIHIEN
jgi:hypothetical protein